MSLAEEIARKLIERSSREHGPTAEAIAAALEEFAQEEREWCAKIAQQVADEAKLFDTVSSASPIKAMQTGRRNAALAIAARIREGHS